jgi:hypothetical protein
MTARRSIGASRRRRFSPTAPLDDGQAPRSAIDPDQLPMAQDDRQVAGSSPGQ